MPGIMVVYMELHIMKFVNGIPWRGLCVKHYSPGEIMMDCCLNANNCKLSVGVYCQVAENAESTNSLAPRARAAISLGNSGNLLGSQMLLALDTGHTITQHQWVVLPLPPAVIAQVNLLGNIEPSLLTFTNQCGREICDHPQDFEPSEDDDGSVVEHLTDKTPGVVPAPEDDAELPVWTQILMPSPQEWRWTVIMPLRSLLRLMALSNKIQMRRSLSKQAPSQPLRPQLRHKLHHPRRRWRHAMPEIGRNLRSIFSPCQERSTLLHWLIYQWLKCWWNLYQMGHTWELIGLVWLWPSYQWRQPSRNGA